MIASSSTPYVEREGLPSPGIRLVSGDSHVLEPADLWVSRMDRALRGRAPRLVAGPDAGDALFVADGLHAAPVAGFGAAGVETDALVSFQGTGLTGLRAGGWDPVARLVDQDIDGVCAEVLYPSLAMRLFGVPDGAYQAACFCAYNDWLAEFVAHDRSRLAGLALLCVHDVASARAEARRCRSLGLSGCLISVGAPLRRPYSDPCYTPLWAELEALKLPVILHVLTSSQGEGPPRPFAPSVHRYLSLARDVQESLADLVLSGVLERHPGLRVVSAENDAGWLPHFSERLDRAYERLRAFDGVRLRDRPSDLLRRQLYLTFQVDAAAIRDRHIIGVDRLVWGSDYPHLDSTWPRSQGALSSLLAEVPADEAEQIVRMNATKLFWSRE